MYKYAENYQKFNEFGVVKEINYPIVKIKGLPNVCSGEVVVFENNTRGQTLLLDEYDIEVLLLSQQVVPVGMRVARTENQLSISISQNLKGAVIDPLGNLLIDTQNKPDIAISDSSPMESMPKQNLEMRQIDIPPLSIAQRYQITEPLLTGVSIVDLLLPLGKGQRELIVGDRKTGKTSYLLSAIKSQVNQGVVAIYVAIGKQVIDVEIVREWFQQQGILDQVVIVAATAQNAQSLIYLAPFTGMTLAEYFRDKGQDTLVVLDDLSTHAKFYREISLLAKRFPGRDSYPGDIFFTHARLLERAGNYIHKTQGNVSISCMPVAETIENDLSDYIVSNLIGITDGHLLFDSTEFIKGRIPAINPTLSVTRVGRQTQSLVHQDISQRLMSFITEYNNSQRFSHLGTELTDSIKDLLNKGKILFDFFNQEPALVLPLNVQIFFIALIWQKFFEDGSLPLPLAEGQRKQNSPPDKTSLDSQKPTSSTSQSNNSSSATISQYLSRLLNAYQKPKTKNWLDKIVDLNDWYKILDEIKLEKGKIISICKEN